MFAPQSPEDIRGQEPAKERVREWLQRGRGAQKAKPTLFSSALVLTGPPGCGKTALARCCIAEAGFAIMEFGPHCSQDLPSFLRTAGAVDCDGRRTCLLLDELPQVMEAKCNAGAGSAAVSFPVICTADFIVRRACGQYGAVFSMYALRPRDLREMLQRRLAPRLGLTQASFGQLVVDARGDGRQLCVLAAFTATLAAGTTLRDHSLPPYEKVRTLLGGGRDQEVGARRAVQADDLSHQEFCLLQENFAVIPDVSLESAADFAADLALMDVLDAGGEANGAAAALSACVRRGGKSIGRTKLADYGDRKSVV